MKYVLLVVMLAFFVPAQHASACSCSTLTVERQLQVADYAFSGTVIRVDTVDVRYHTAIVSVDTVWKGDVTTEFEVWTRSVSSSCGYHFEIGARYVVYAYDPSSYLDQVYTHICTRTDKYADAADDVAQLGPGTVPVTIQGEPSQPSATALGPAHPNPAYGQVSVFFSLPELSAVELTVYDLLGRPVEQIASGVYASGTHWVHWKTNGYASGVYSYRLRQGGRVLTRQLLVRR